MTQLCVLRYSGRMYVDHNIFTGLGLPENVLSTVAPATFDAFLASQGWTWPVITKAETLVFRAKEEAAGWFRSRDWRPIYRDMLTKAKIRLFGPADLQEFLAHPVKNNPPLRVRKGKKGYGVVWAGTGTPVPGGSAETREGADRKLRTLLNPQGITMPELIADVDHAEWANYDLNRAGVLHWRAHNNPRDVQSKC